MDRICRVTGKRCYAGKSEARKGMRRLSDRLRIYACKHCNKWHLTSRMIKKRRPKKKKSPPPSQNGNIKREV